MFRFVLFFFVRPLAEFTLANFQARGLKIRLVVGGYVTNDTHCGNKLLGFERVPKHNFVSSLQGYRNSLEQVVCFQGFEGDLFLFFYLDRQQVLQLRCSTVLPFRWLLARSGALLEGRHILLICLLLPLLLLRLRSPRFLQCGTERRYPER